MKRIELLLGPVVGGLALVAPTGVSWAADDGQTAVDSAGEALRERMQIPWYDAEADALKPVEFSEPWQPNWDLSWLAWMVEPLNVLLISIAILLVAILLWVMFKVVRDRQANANKS